MGKRKREEIYEEITEINKTWRVLKELEWITGMSDGEALLIPYVPIETKGLASITTNRYDPDVFLPLVCTTSGSTLCRGSSMINWIPKFTKKSHENLNYFNLPKQNLGFNFLSDKTFPQNFLSLKNVNHLHAEQKFDLYNQWEILNLL